MTDWFRKTTWTEDDQQHFWAKHRRARGNYNKAQYLRIQALCLAETGKPDLLKAAMNLLNLMTAEFPEPSQLSCAYLQRGEILFHQAKLDEALAEYRAAIAQERVYLHAKTQCWLHFGWAVVAYQRSDLYDEALKYLAERGREVMFPIDFYRTHAILAITAWAQNDKASAREHAEAALKQAARKHSGFRYHPTVGLVKETDDKVRKQLTIILKGEPLYARLLTKIRQIARGEGGAEGV